MLVVRVADNRTALCPKALGGAVTRLGLRISTVNLDQHRVVHVLAEHRINGGQIGPVAVASELHAVGQSAAQIGIAAQDLPTLFEAWALENQITDRVAPQLLAPDAAARQAYDQLKGSYQGQTYEELAPLLRQLLVFDQRRQAALPVLQDEARRVGVRVNPRFGTWNLDRLDIGAPPTDLARPSTPPPAPGGSSAESGSVPVAPSP